MSPRAKKLLQVVKNILKKLELIGIFAEVVLTEKAAKKGKDKNKA